MARKTYGQNNGDGTTTVTCDCALCGQTVTVRLNYSRPITRTAAHNLTEMSRKGIVKVA